MTPRFFRRIEDPAAVKRKGASFPSSGGLAYIRILEYALLRRAICVQEEYSMRHAPTSAAGPVSTPDLDLD
ncbi:hypothetical protein VB636_11910, partial [Paracoccus sp. APAP_BH8]|uniref:hypothetical protein n=1 Tax=Paracoccus sp. APAP_BH8 TaxID=3110237 RepID=UPI002FD7CE59